MKCLYLAVAAALLPSLLSPDALLATQGRTATVHVRIVNTYSDEEIGAAKVETLEREYGDVPSGNLAGKFERNIATNVPYDFYKLCARATGYWTECTEVPVYQPEVWVVLGLRVGMGPAGLSDLAGLVKNVPTEQSQVWVRLMGVYWGMMVDARVDGSGHFRMSGIPPGKWVLVTIQDNRILNTLPVTLPATGPVEIDLRR